MGANPAHTAELTFGFESTDATDGNPAFPLWIKGSQYTKNKSIDAGTIVLTCAGVNVGANNGAITVDDNGNFNYSSFTLNYNLVTTALANAPPGQSWVWCETMSVPENGGCAWTFPNTVRLDRTTPDITTPGNFYLYPLTPALDGRVCFNWYFNDPVYTPLDEDGPNGADCPAADDWECNRTSHRAKIIMHSRDFDVPGYSSASVFIDTLIPSTGSFCGASGLTALDRDDPSNVGLCFKARVKDTAAYYSGFSPDGAGEKCVILDGKDPSVLSVDYYLDSLFTMPFPLNSSGQRQITTNACYINADCDTTASRYVYLKIVTSEPLNDGQNPWGHTIRLDDGFDNDNDGFVDEETGGFNNIDDDADSGAFPAPAFYFDEDASMTGCTPGVPAMTSNDKIDNDCDGYIDEEYDNDKDEDTCHPENGSDFFCRDISGNNIDEDLISTSCGDKKTYNRPLTLTGLGSPYCLRVPTVAIGGAGDQEGFVPLQSGRNKRDVLKWVCTKGFTSCVIHDNGGACAADSNCEWDGANCIATAGGIDSLCDDLSAGQSIYRYVWDVTGPLGDPGLGDDGSAEEYDVTFSMADSVGNESVNVSPQAGGAVKVDNAPPTVTVSFKSDPSYQQSFIVVDHDNDSDAKTPDMPVAREGNVYVSLVFSEYIGATPTVGLYLPDATATPYQGNPQLDNLMPLTAYTTCGQNLACDPCTGESCVGYASSTDPCTSFRACFAAASTTMNNGFASIGVYSKDMLENSLWDPITAGGDPDARAKASQLDADDAHDDTDTNGGDGYPTYLGPHANNPLNNEPDAQVLGRQYIAFDFVKPDPPAASLPISPCDGEVARVGGSCSPSIPTTNTPTLSWATLADGNDNDGDGDTDEEVVDGLDDDGDGDIDEDATGTTHGWSVRLWHIQVATENTFGTSSIVVESNSVSGTTYSTGMLPERTATSPYYWRIAAIDYAGNEGDFTPAIPNPYWRFAIDTRDPQLSVSYYTDAARTIPLSTNANGTPVTGDTAEVGGYIYIKIASNEEIGATPTFRVTQNSQIAIPDTATTLVSETVAYGQFQVDALGPDKDFSEGDAIILITTEDMFGNGFTNAEPATGSKFSVDAQAPSVTPSDITVTPPSPVSRDNDGDWVQDELVNDAVKVQVKANEKLLNPYFLPATEFKVKIIQQGVPTGSTPDDLLDNDCDGLIDEETTDGADNDGDNQIDEDEGSSGAQAGSGCLITMTWDGGTGGSYTGYYNVVPGYDGAAQIVIGSSDSSSRYYVTDYAGNPVNAASSFTVDTTPPLPVTLLIPKNGSYTSNTTPQFSWQVNRGGESGLDKYLIQIATSSNMDALATNFFATTTVADDGQSTTFNYLPSTPLADNNTYYWRVFAIDTARNHSATGSTYSFIVDLTAPSPPKFELPTGEKTPTKNSSIKLQGKSFEPDSYVKIYVNDTYVGTMKSDNTADGKFTVSVDDDGDGAFDEDPIDGEDDDEDGLLDEDPEGIFLQEGKNSIAGQVTDTAGNTGSRGCAASTAFYDTDDGKCYLVRDSGYPTFIVSYFQDINLTVPLPQKCTDPQVPSTCLSAAKAGTVYMKITASEELGELGDPREPTFSIRHQGSESVDGQPTVSIDGSLTAFKGSYTVNAANGSTYIDGNATIYVVGTDNQNPPNTTPSDTVPSTGGYFAIDTTAPKFTILYFSDEDFLEPLPKDTTLVPNAKAGDVYMYIRANEELSDAPVVTVSQQGSVDPSATSTEQDDSGLYFQHNYVVNAANGSSYVDGLAGVTFTASDIAGNLGAGIVPTTGSQFKIDTTAPAVPTLTPETFETIFTQVNATGEAEAFAKVEVFARLNRDMEVNDVIDNDGDGRIDEEPNSSDGVDNDNDLFIDEDITTTACAAGQYWATGTSCVNTPLFEPSPGGVAYADEAGDYSVTITGIRIGKNLVYARAIDTAGNVSDLLDFTPLEIENTAAENVTLTHEFEAGWNLVGIPFQPTILTPQSGLRLSGYNILRLQDAVYASGYDVEGMAPGKCYWIYFAAPTTVSSVGITSTTQSVFLSEGWNMMGILFNKSVAWDSNVQVKVSGSAYNLGTTDANTAVNSTIYLYDPATDLYSGKSITSGTTLNPWEGFMIKAEQECELIFPE